MKQGALSLFTRHIFTILFIGVFALSVQLSGSAWAALVSWNVNTDGLWSSATNWDSNPSLPGPTDDVYIFRPAVDVTVTHSSGNYSINSLDCDEKLIVAGGTLSIASGVHMANTLTLNTGNINFNYGSETQIVGSTTLNGGILGGSSTVRFIAPLTWLKGTVSGSGTVIAESGIIFSGTGSPCLDGRTLSNLGSTTFTGSNYLYGSNGAVFNNAVGAAVNLLGKNNLYYSGTTSPPIFNNYGTFTLNSTDKTCISYCNFVMNNSGIVDVQQGTLNLSGSGTSSGTFNVASGASLEFSLGTYTLNGPTFNNAAAITLSGGTLTCGSTTTTNISGAVNFKNGMINGSGDMTVNGPLTWLKGTMSGGGVTNAMGGMVFSGNSDPVLNNRVLNNSGNATFLDSNYLHGSNGAILNNLAGAVIDVQGLNNFVNDGGTLPTINNAGTFRKSSTSPVTVGFAMNNTGGVEVQHSTLSFQGGVAQMVGTALTDGEWIVRAGSTLTMLPAGNIVTNQGKVTLDGIGSTFTKINTLADNQGSFSVLNGRNFSTVGDMANSGELTVGTGSNFNVAGDLPGMGDVTVGGVLTADSIIQNTLTIGAGGWVTIRPVSGGPLAADVRLSAVPEPSSIVMLLCAAGSLLFAVARKR